MVGGDEVVALVLGDEAGEAAPNIGPEHPRAAAVEPFQLRIGHQEHAAQHEMADPLGMLLGIEKRERRAPAPAEHDPAVDAERLPDELDVAHQMPGRVRLDRGVRARPPAAALVEQHDAEHARIEIAPHRRRAAPAGSAMQHNHRQTVGLAALLHIDPVAVADVENALIERVDRRIEVLRRAFIACTLVHDRSI